MVDRTGTQAAWSVPFSWWCLSCSTASLSDSVCRSSSRVDSCGGPIAWRLSMSPRSWRCRGTDRSIWCTRGSCQGPLATPSRTATSGSSALAVSDPLGENGVCFRWMAETVSVAPTVVWFHFLLEIKQKKRVLVRECWVNVTVHTGNKTFQRHGFCEGIGI